MTLTDGLIWGGSALALVGLVLLGWCIRRALALRGDSDAEATRTEMQRLVAINLAAVGIASIGLGCVTVGLIL